jgi:hypothetical protein
MRLDSLITQKKPSGMLRAKDWTSPKVIRVDAYRGLISYWGLATWESLDWSTLKWLEKTAARADRSASPESFANQLAQDLNTRFNSLGLPQDHNRGIGIHFTAYEQVENVWVPELFLITNWTDPLYRSIFPDGLHVTRETFSTITGIPKHFSSADAYQRAVVHQCLAAGRIFMFNNGDPILFNPAAAAIHQMYQTLRDRGILKSKDDPATAKALVLKAIKLVGEIQKMFCKDGTQRVGGKPHVRCVTPDGRYI